MGKMKIKCVIDQYNKPGNCTAKLGHGTMYILNSNNQVTHKIPFQTGGWGNGPAEPGEYAIDYYDTPDQIAKLPNKEAYSLTYDDYTYGFYFHLQPKFVTERSGLGIHIDGSVPGTLGCIGLQIDDIDIAKEIYKLLAGAMAMYGSVDVYVEQIINARMV